MVPVYAIGAGSELFQGLYDNTDIPKKILSLLEITK
jgi:alkaline phosphatase